VGFDDDLALVVARTGHERFRAKCEGGSAEAEGMRVTLARFAAHFRGEPDPFPGHGRPCGSYASPGAAPNGRDPTASYPDPEWLYWFAAIRACPHRTNHDGCGCQGTCDLGKGLYGHVDETVCRLCLEKKGAS
jgi:hypothetical protein